MVLVILLDTFIVAAIYPINMCTWVCVCVY